MKPFNLEAALAGAPVVTRGGDIVTEIFHFKTVEGIMYPVIAIVDGERHSFTTTGKYNVTMVTHDNDLFMGTEKKEGWVNVYQGYKDEHFTGRKIYPTQEAADQGRSTEGIAVKIEWEE